MSLFFFFFEHSWQKHCCQPNAAARCRFPDLHSHIGCFHHVKWLNITGVQGCPWTSRPQSIHACTAQRNAEPEFTAFYFTARSETYTSPNYNRLQTCGRSIWDMSFDAAPSALPSAALHQHKSKRHLMPGTLPLLLMLQIIGCCNKASTLFFLTFHTRKIINSTLRTQ